MWPSVPGFPSIVILLHIIRGSSRHRHHTLFMAAVFRVQPKLISFNIINYHLLSIAIQFLVAIIHSGFSLLFCYFYSRKFIKPHRKGWTFSEVKLIYEWRFLFLLVELRNELRISKSRKWRRKDAIFIFPFSRQIYNILRCLKCAR